MVINFKEILTLNKDATVKIWNLSEKNFTEDCQEFVQSYNVIKTKNKKYLNFYSNLSKSYLQYF